jgi:hypothetical protein
MSLNQEIKTKNIWYFKNQEPLIQAKRKGRSQSFYGALNLKTGKETAVKVKRQNSKASIEFLKRLGETYADKHILLLWDNASDTVRFSVGKIHVSQQDNAEKPWFNQLKGIIVS